MEGGLCSGWYGLSKARRRTFPLFVTRTLEAPSKRSLSPSPMARKGESCIQHVCTVQLPDIPWHLHCLRMPAITCCKDREKQMNKVILKTDNEMHSSFQNNRENNN